MIVKRDRRAEDGQQTVAAITDQRAVLLEDRIEDVAEVLVKQLDHLLRLGLLTNAVNP